MAKDKVAAAWQVVECGVNYPDYFSGFGVSFTEYTDCAVGIGDTPQEALDDALEMLAQSGWNVDLITETLDDGPSLAEEDEAEWDERQAERLAAWIEEQEAEGKVNSETATPEQLEDDDTEFFNPDDFQDSEWNGDSDGEGMTRYYYVGVRVREYDPDRDEPHVGHVARAVGRLSALQIAIHNHAVRLRPNAIGRPKGQGKAQAKRRLHKMRQERNRLERFRSAARSRRTADSSHWSAERYGYDCERGTSPLSSVSPPGGRVSWPTVTRLSDRSARRSGTHTRRRTGRRSRTIPDTARCTARTPGPCSWISWTACPETETSARRSPSG
jgi:hypothetical protein